MSSGRGGQDNEIGSEYRARLGALLATAVLLADDVADLGSPVAGVPVSLRAEADTPIDDLVLRFEGQTTACIQAKHRVDLTTGVDTPFGKAMRQFVVAHRATPASSDGPFVLAYAKGSEPLADLGKWCRKLRFAEAGIPSPKELDAAASLRKLLERLGVHAEDEVLALSRRVHLWKTDPRDGDAKSVVIQRLRDVGVPPAQRGDAYDELTARVRVLAQYRAGDDLTSLVTLLRANGHLA